MAAVFTATNLGCVFGVYESGIEVRLFGRCRVCGGDGCGDFLRVYCWFREDQLYFGGLRRVLDGADRMGGIVADELLCSVDDHLWGVGTVHAQARAVVALPFGVLVRGEAVVPAEVIPVVDMLAEHNDLRAIYGLRLVEPGQKNVGGRTAG